MLDLWPKEIEYTQIKAPVTILREQASLLGSKTKNIVMAEVGKAVTSSQIASENMVSIIENAFGRDTLKPRNSKERFAYIFYLVAPALGNYQYELFTIINDIRLYPVLIILEDDILTEIAPDKDKNLLANSEDEFLEILGKIFQSQKTKRIIQSILAQSVSPPVN